MVIYLSCICQAFPLVGSLYWLLTPDDEDSRRHLIRWEMHLAQLVNILAQWFDCLLGLHIFWGFSNAMQLGRRSCDYSEHSPYKFLYFNVNVIQNNYEGTSECSSKKTLNNTVGFSRDKTESKFEYLSQQIQVRGLKSRVQVWVPSTITKRTWVHVTCWRTVFLQWSPH